MKINAEKCTGCGDCVSVCPAEAIKIENNKAVVDKDSCTECSVCAGSCSQQAITLS